MSAFEHSWRMTGYAEVIPMTPDRTITSGLPTIRELAHVATRIKPLDVAKRSYPVIIELTSHGLRITNCRDTFSMDHSMKLATGRFYGVRVRARIVPGFILNEVYYGPNLVLPKHSHEQAYFSFVWRGGYQEQCGQCLRGCEPATAAFHPAGEVHADRFSDLGGHLLNLEFKPWVLETVK